MTCPILCLVVDRRVARRPLAEAVAHACGEGVDWLQLRERELAGADWLAWAEELAAVARAARPGLRVIVNRRLDVALAIGADGVHLGFDGLAPADARAVLGERALIGVSTHDPDEVRTAAADASYAQLAPIFDPRSKQAYRPALGLEALTRASRHGLPLIAQGGLDPERSRAAIGAGAAGVAVTGAILMSDRPDLATRALRQALDRAAGDAQGA